MQKNFQEKAKFFLVEIEISKTILNKDKKKNNFSLRANKKIFQKKGVFHDRENQEIEG